MFGPDIVIQVFALHLAEEVRAGPEVIEHEIYPADKC